MSNRHRSPARMLAPVALAAFAVALVFVLATSDAPEDSGTASDPTAETDTGRTPEETDTTETERSGREDRLPEGCYVVKAGDTLAGIAQSTGLQVEALQDLNPDVDAQALVSGQRLNLREAGCD